MNNLLLTNTFLQNYGMLIALVLILGALMLFNIMNKRKEDTYKQGLRQEIVVGAKVKTYAGIYGTVKALNETTDGTIVTIESGTGKKSATFDIHIDAIYAIDMKEDVEYEEIIEYIEEPVTEDQTTEVVESEPVVEDKPKTPAKKSTAKSKTNTESTTESKPAKKRTTTKKASE